MLGTLLLLSPTHLGWDFKGEQVEAPGGQGLQREEKKVSSKWQLSGPSSPCSPFAPSACVTLASSGPLLWGPLRLSQVSPLVSWTSTQSGLPLSQVVSPRLSPTSVSSAL